ncbi:ABC-three component system protein [Wohlfahrtiimonas chitiniclastica]|uniref:ABC-three component system protein n=1 Tax=Wohlfahrtiimonas chitiniclastica TaxID=400946 RepID=UPI001FEE50CF|nr:ABC-three component system protein [Wohlfahrtiimonas chitiniclastica]
MEPKLSNGTFSSLHVQSGVPIPKPTRVKFFSPEEWEVFTEEWASSLKNTYAHIRRFGGSGDMGIDIAGFCSDQRFEGVWDNFQCKKYDHPLRPSDIWVEIGKIIYYSYKKKYVPPRHYYFIGSQGIGTSLEKLLGNPTELCSKMIENWERYCLNEITSTESIPLDGALKDYFDSFNFAIFSSKSVVELIELHSKTPFHSVRFGGGLPVRPSPILPPVDPTKDESLYIRYMLDAYGDSLGENLADISSLEFYSDFKKHYLRQREYFYHAESLKNFARDTVPDGTFRSLQDEVYHGIIDTCEDVHTNGFERMKATINQATIIATTSNPLVSSIKTQDRKGICHQLANDDRLKWVE